MLTAILATLFVIGGPPAARAQDAAEATWKMTALTDRANRLYTPASGALFAHTVTGLVRTEDAGDSWSAVTLPTAAPIEGMSPENPATIMVDPTDHTISYAATADGLYKTSDDGQSWALLLPTVGEAPWFQALAISPADNRRLYVALSHPEERRLLLMRSDDGGATWTTADRRELPSPVACTWDVALFQAHPTDADRLFLAAACSRNATQIVLQASRDGGATWTDLYTPTLAKPRWLVVGNAAAPGRLVLGLNKDARTGGSLVIRSDDNGATWTTALEFTGGGSMSGGGPNVTIGGLAVDPTSADHLLLGLNASSGDWDTPAPIRTSQDGGETWHEEPTPADGLGTIRDVSFGIDGRLLFLATDNGVWRASAP
jgi:photosystem II stability/assembly factor-like uncharacterized protein